MLLACAASAALGACTVEDTVLTPDPQASSAGSGGQPQGGASGMAGGASGTGGGGGGSGGSGGDASMTGDPDGSMGPAVDAGPTAVAKDPDCDLNGIWAVRQVAVTTALGAPQYQNAWSYVEIVHDGSDFMIAKQFECGGEVMGTIHVTLTADTTRSLMDHNHQAGRRGTMQKGGDGSCAFTLETFWGLRGAVEASYVPADGRNTTGTLSELQSDRPLPTAAAPTGAEDWDMDGFLGVALNASGAVTGTRHSVQRDWSRAFSDAEYLITPSVDWNEDIVVRQQAEAEDSVFATEPAGNLLLAAGTVSDANNVNNRMTLRFLGRTAADARVAALPVTGTDPVSDPAGTLATCFAIQDALPAAEAR
jgi:hypothetical protein